LANRLSLDHSVTVIEAGPADYPWDFRLHMPAALSHVLSNDTYNWFYQSEREPYLNNRNMYCPRGRVLGGSSSINGMVYVRGHPQDFDNWATLPGLENWSFEHCLPYFKRAEDCAHGDEEIRGRGGPLHIGRSKANNPLVNAWLSAGVEAGYDQTPDMNGWQQEGMSVFESTIKNGRRFSTAQAYLHPIKRRTNLAIRKKSLATRILFDQEKAIGLEFRHGGRLHTIEANKEVILCGGAINSPQLLMLSGIGNADDLTQLHIPVVSDLPGVGQNLQDHMEVYIQYSCLKPVSIYPALRWFNQPAIGIEWYLFSKGLGATNHFEAGAFLKSSSAVQYPDLQFHFLPVAMNYDGKQMHKGHGFQLHVGPMKPKSRGTITLRSNDPSEHPRILFNYNSAAEDREVMRKGVRLARGIIAQLSFDEYRGIELRPGAQKASDDELDSFIRQHGESAYHPSCTCKMGEDSLAVVDGDARVHGIDSLRVVDASIMPEITNGNLNAPVIMMAEKLSDVILGH
jgi:choline dehydrogenase